MGYISWAFIGMVGYSLVTMLVKLATRTGRFPSFLVLAIATSIVAASAITIALARGDFGNLRDGGLASREMLIAVATGIALAVAVASLFQALSLGPASVVVPIYGMFIVGGAVLGVTFLHEPVSVRKVAGILCAVVGIYLIAGTPAR
jgi:transporter family protein